MASATRSPATIIQGVSDGLCRQIRAALGPQGCAVPFDRAWNQAIKRQPLPRARAFRMVRGRGSRVGVEAAIGSHFFGATEITACWKNGGTMERAETRRTMPRPAPLRFTIARRMTCHRTRWSGR